MPTALKKIARRLAASFVGDDPMPDTLTGLDILHRCGPEAYRSWRDAGCPAVTATSLERRAEHENQTA